MKVWQTAALQPGEPYSETEAEWVYNGLDCCVTLEVLEVIKPQLDNLTGRVYSFEKALQGPILDMSMRGVRVNFYERKKAIASYTEELNRIEKNFHRLCVEGLGLPKLNWRSPDQLKYLFYDVLNIKPVMHKGRPTTNRDALESLRFIFHAEPLINHILHLRDIAKKKQTLETSVDSDGRMRTSFNIAGTNTGRLSSSISEFEEAGGNMQNIEDRLRRVFIADEGMKFGYIDLEQAESRGLGAIIWNHLGDGKYLDACESGDLHTSVARLAKRKIAWTGDLALDRAIAEQPFYRQHSLRHMCKVLGHGSNYLGQPWTMEKHTKIPQPEIRAFQHDYFDAFPGIPQYHEWVRWQLKHVGYLISLMGRKRWFFGRPDEDATVRKAVAFDPQGSIGDILNTAMLRVWWSNQCQLLLQVHDAILVQYPQEREDEILPQLLSLMEVPIELERGRTLLIPSEAKVGWNWASFADDNPDGLKKYKGHDDRSRTFDPKVVFMG